MLESKLYARLRPHFQLWGESSRVENAIESGMPDNFVCFNQVPGWVETKIIKRREGFECLWFQKFQIPWMRRYFAAGLSQVFVIGGFDDERGTMIVYHVKEIINAPTHPYQRWSLVRLTDINTVLELRKPYDWNLLRTLLSTQYPVTK